MSISINETQATLAHTLAAIDNANLSSAVLAVATAKQEYQGGPMKVYFYMTQAYSEEQMASFPKPGTGHPKTDKDYAGNNPDYFKVPSFGKDGKRTEKSVSFYVEYADNTPAGKPVCQRIDYIQRAGNDKAKQDDIPADVLALNPHQRDVELKKLETKRATIRSSFKSAIKLGFQFEAINALDHVAAVAIPGVKEGEFENMILVRSTIAGRETIDYEHYTISAFMRLDADKAAEKDGTLAALKATVKRDKPDDNSGTASGTTVVIKTVDTLGKVFNDAYAFMDEAWSASDKAKYTELLKQLGPRGGAGTDLMASAFYNVWRMLNDVYKHDAIRERGVALYQAEQPVGKAA